MSPDDARAAVKKVTSSIDEAQAVGDLDGLRARLEALTPLVAQQREKRKAERAAKVEEARSAKTKIATEAETIAAGTDWRHGVTRLRELLDEWKALPRLDKSSDDELWHRFSSARTTYTRHRKQHFAELSSKRDEAAVVKERLAAEAETLVVVHRLGSDVRPLPRPDAPVEGRRPGAARGRRQAVGPVPQPPRTPSSAPATPSRPRRTPSRRRTSQAKEALLVEIEAILPVNDAKAAREQLRDLLDRWDADRQGPARLDARHRRPPARRRAGRQVRRGRGLEPQQPRGPRPRRGHGQAAPVPDRRPREAGRQGTRPRATPARPTRPAKPSKPAENG